MVAEEGSRIPNPSDPLPKSCSISDSPTRSKIVGCGDLPGHEA
jgi:hypothetical protein